MVERLRQRLIAVLGPPGEDFRAQLLAVATMVGVPVSWLSALINLILGGPIESVLVNLLAGFAILGLFAFARHTGRYQLTYVIAAITLFLGVFPWLFFSGGGITGGMPIFFMFAIAFSAILLERVALWVMVPTEAVVFAACLYVAYRYPQTVTPFSSPLSQVIDIAFAMIATGIAMVVSVRMLVGIYERNRQQLQQRNAELARIDVAKTEFLAMVAHELNTPLAVVRIHAEESSRRLAERPGPADAELANLAVIEAESTRLAHLVTQLLDLARIDDDSIALRLRPEVLDTLVQQALQAYGAVWAQTGNTIEVRRNSSSPPVLVDRERFLQILVNLVSNAVRHTRDGTVTIGVQVLDFGAELSVVDTGEGIPPSLLANLGDQPLRGHRDGVRSAKDAGLGVGLVITKHLVTAHGGSFSIESVVGEGTTVRCSFPLA